MRKALAALALAGSSVAFAEHKAFQEKYIIGCSTEQIATANSITDSFRVGDGRGRDGDGQKEGGRAHGR